MKGRESSDLNLPGARLKRDRYDADPVLEAKDYSYLQEMLCSAIEQTESASKVASHKEGEQRPSVTSKPSDTRHIMAPPQRPPPPGKM